MGKPRFLLADEPTGNLDYRTGDMIMGMLGELHRSHRLTSIYVTHNLAFARRCDRIMRLEGGTLSDVSPLLPDGAALRDPIRL